MKNQHVVSNSLQHCVCQDVKAFLMAFNCSCRLDAGKASSLCAMKTVAVTETEATFTSNALVSFTPQADIPALLFAMCATKSVWLTRTEHGKST
mmetsp:Transcript_49024/g.88144  ORF Transcript_49024/g.88144 Transcript_49024/m.88144 type:complete len:94 (-) Transcript_49024:1264-1545(-)